jgi:DNA-3-methyladenine glycosylase II
MTAPAATRQSNGLSYDPKLACRHLSRADARLGDLISQVGEFTLRPIPTQSVFAALMRSIVYQQLTGKAAETILRRVCQTCGPRRFPTPRQLLSISVEQLRTAGLAEKTLDGTVPSLARIRRLTDAEVIEQLTRVRGIGPWTVEMLLMFRLGRPDVFPVADLGVRKGFGLVFRRGRLPEPAVMLRRAERWRPYRSVASWYLWRALEL